jgi:hypothetical protein
MTPAESRRSCFLQATQASTPSAADCRTHVCRTWQQCPNPALEVNFGRGLELGPLQAHSALQETTRCAGMDRKTGLSTHAKGGCTLC